ncbi:MAG: alpha/beta hydrolase fold domain-containing protein, partial [Bacteroidota bacterium]|nr:alpha/beta hydrolase fold domain-containing protein [Bacteroidota bacterium]
TNKIAVVGFSAGGELAAFLGATNGNPVFAGKGCLEEQPSAVDAVIDLDGTLSFVHPESGEGDDSKRISAATYWFGYPKAAAMELWTEASPLTHAGKHTPPTLFINSSVERMHAGRDDFMKVLKANGTYTDVKTFADAPHTFPLYEPWFSPTVKYIDDFLKKVFRN